MHNNIFIAGSGIWYPEARVSNEELVNSYNQYVENLKKNNRKYIEDRYVEAMEF